MVVREFFFLFFFIVLSVLIPRLSLLFMLWRSLYIINFFSLGIDLYEWWLLTSSSFLEMLWALILNERLLSDDLISLVLLFDFRLFLSPFWPNLKKLLLLSLSDMLLLPYDLFNLSYLLRLFDFDRDFNLFDFSDLADL